MCLLLTVCVNIYCAARQPAEEVQHEEITVTCVSFQIQSTPLFIQIIQRTLKIRHWMFLQVVEYTSDARQDLRHIQPNENVLCITKDMTMQNYRKSLLFLKNVGKLKMHRFMGP